MRAFVTGAGGFVGRRLMARLNGASPAAASGGSWDAVGFDRELDVTDQAVLRRAIAQRRPDVLVHLAAQSSVPASREDPLGCFRTNVLGTRNLLAAVASEAPAARVLLVGSGDVYGPAAPGARASREGDPLRPGSVYSRTKWAAEWFGQQALRDGLDVVCVRPFNHTGDGQTDRFVASSFARQVAELARRGGRGTLRVGNLDAARDFLDVEDVIDAYVALLDRSVPARIYNIASGQPLRIGTLLDRLLGLAGVEATIEVEESRWRPADALFGDASRLREATGWQPRIDLDRTLRELLDGWQRADGGHDASGGADAAPSSH